ncbi:protein of unknown function DUF554 [Spirochaeta thermophila DSM 6578]|uniref:DUF554 domain-containing protein n=1 Tax=Winmispira thermophila (strain ATCC 700085 / DSM 6578 / Z-1203) TaxID=869211 RepID=G0GCP5_WINT7|nr:DUF554 domain-containing protein [Spirochaeta thermophila]AEJ60464.1 protein of unknown function DUF554 [Spirochaeta thermophila DSM 6578]
MIATFVNMVTVIVGSLLGLLFHARISEDFKKVVYQGVGIFTLVIGLSMALESQRVLWMALSLVAGGILGTWWDIEGGIYRFGEFLKRRVARAEGESTFASGFLDASILFCVGAMTLVGAFKAGTEGDYTLLLTKSVMDGFMAILLTAALGMGVAFSALTILVYQGGLTLLSGFLQPLVTETILNEVTGVGGAMVIMIGLNLLGVTRIKTGNFFPALILVVPLCFVPWF